MYIEPGIWCCEIADGEDVAPFMYTCFPQWGYVFKECVRIFYWFAVLPDQFVMLFCPLLALNSAYAIEAGGVSGLRCCPELVRDFVFLG